MSGGCKYSMGAVLHCGAYVNDLDFHESGTNLVLSTTNSLHLIDAATGTERKKVLAKSHGIGSVKYTHHDMCVLVSSVRRTHDIRYLSLHDNKYLRYFRGHSEEVTSISMSPVDDFFLSAAHDRTVCLWNLNTSSPIAKLRLDMDSLFPYASYDKTGLVFGVMCRNSVGKHSLKLFDARKYDKGPFADIIPTDDHIKSALAKTPKYDPSVLERNVHAEWTGFEFSSDGRSILINTAADMVLVVDSFNPSLEPLALRCRDTGAGPNYEPCYDDPNPAIYRPPRFGATFTPDSKHLLVGAWNNDIHMCDAATGEVRSTLRGHISPVKRIVCNPVYDMFASTCVCAALWLPTP